MSMEERDWARLGEALQAARRAAGLTQQELADALDAGRSTVQKVERGAAFTKVQPIHRAMARHWGWTESSIEKVLAGGEPEIAEPRQSSVPSALSGLPLRVLQALGEGRLVDSLVLNLDPDAPESTATLVLKLGNVTDASPAEMREQLRKWAELQRAAARIYGDDESSK